MLFSLDIVYYGMPTNKTEGKKIKLKGVFGVSTIWMFNRLTKLLLLGYWCKTGNCVCSISYTFLLFPILANLGRSRQLTVFKREAT
jgi:hypothetical protein